MQIVIDISEDDYLNYGSNSNRAYSTSPNIEGVNVDGGWGV